MIFLANSSQLGVFWPMRGLPVNHGTALKGAIFPQPGNQKRVKWSNTACVNKWSFTFKTKLCAFQVTKILFCMKVIQTFTTQPVKISHFKSPLTRKQARWPHFFQCCMFLMFISWMLITPSFRKSLIVEQFQGIKRQTWYQWNHRYLHQWRYGKYATLVPDVVSYEFYEWCIFQ